MTLDECTAVVEAVFPGLKGEPGVYAWSGGPWKVLFGPRTGTWGVVYTHLGLRGDYYSGKYLSDSKRIALIRWTARCRDQKDKVENEMSRLKFAHDDLVGALEYVTKVLAEETAR